MNVLCIVLSSFLSFVLSASSTSVELSPIDLQICSGTAEPPSPGHFDSGPFNDIPYCELCLETAVNSNNFAVARSIFQKMKSSLQLWAFTDYIFALCHKRDFETANFVYLGIESEVDASMMLNLIVTYNQFFAFRFFVDYDHFTKKPLDLLKFLSLLIDSKKWMMLQYVLQDPKIDLSSRAIEKLVLRADLSQIWLDLCNNPTFDVLAGRYALARHAIHQGSMQIIRVLLSRPEFDPSFDSNQLIFSAIRANREAIAIQLVSDQRANIDRSSASLVHEAITKGFFEFVRAVINKGITNVRHLNHIAKLILKSDNSNLYSHLLTNTNFDPAKSHSKVFFEACKFGSVSCFRVLLKDGRADPTAKQQGKYLIETVATVGRCKMVELLLKDPRVDPTVCRNEAVMMANANHHHDCTVLLLEDPRVFNSIALNQVNFLCSGNTSSHEKQLLWKWLLSHDDCKGILTVFDLDRNTNMTMEDLDFVLSHYRKLGAFGIVKLVQRKVYARRLIHNILSERLLGRAVEGLQVYNSLENGFLEDDVEAPSSVVHSDG